MDQSIDTNRLFIADSFISAQNLKNRSCLLSVRLNVLLNVFLVLIFTHQHVKACCSVTIKDTVDIIISNCYVKFKVELD